MRRELDLALDLVRLLLVGVVREARPRVQHHVPVTHFYTGCPLGDAVFTLGRR